MSPFAFDAPLRLLVIDDDEVDRTAIRRHLVAAAVPCAIAALRAAHFPPPPGEEAGKSLGFGFVFQP